MPDTPVGDAELKDRPSMLGGLLIVGLFVVAAAAVLYVALN